MNIKKIKTTFTYKGRKIVIRSKVEDVIRNDEFAYILTGEKGDNHNPEDPYFEINLYTKWTLSTFFRKAMLTISRTLRPSIPTGQLKVLK